MSTVKISQLPEITQINANTANTLFAGVDIPTGATFRMTARTLAQGLYSNEVLNVGTNPVVYDNVVGQFSGSSVTYSQINNQNFNSLGSADYVASISDSGNANNYVDMGINGKDFADPVYSSMKPYDAYVYSHGPAHLDYRGNLVIGTASSTANVVFIAGGTETVNIVESITRTGLTLNGASYLTFADDTRQTTAGSSVANTILLQAALNATNTNTRIALAGVAAANANIALALATNLTQNTDIQSAWNTANTAVQNTATITVNNLKLNGNLTSSGNVTASYLLGNVIGSTIQNTINWLTTTIQPSQQAGQLFFYANTTSLLLDTDIANNRISVSKTLYLRAFNSTGATIPANSWVRLIAGVTPNTVPYIALADATTSANSTVAGFVVSEIANSAYGIVYQSGLVEEFNSTGLGSLGDVLYLSATPGQASNVAPTGSNTVVQVARILNSDPVLGKIQIVTQFRQAYGRPNGSVLYAYANNITSSNTISINDSTQTVTGNNIVANTITISGNTAATSYVNTWTPNVAFSTANGTMTYTAQYGNYVKVGRQVTAYFTLNVTNTGGSGNMFINGLPFAAATGSGSVGLTTTGGVLTGPSVGNLGTISGNVTSGATSTALYTINNTGNGSLTQYPVAAGTGTGGIGSPFTINGMISYISAS